VKRSSTPGNGCEAKGLWAEMWDVASKHHVRALNEQQWSILALASLGIANAGIGDQIGLTEGAVRRELARIRDIVAIPLGVERKDAFSATWFVIHRDCGICRTGILGGAS